MASTTILSTHLDAVSSEKAAILCDECRNPVHGGPFIPSQCSDLAAPGAPCPDVVKPAMAETLPSPAAIRKAKEPRSDHSVAAPRFDCNICLDGCQDPVVTHCGHLFCWPCLYCWISAHSLSYECPVCRAPVRGKIVPLYGRGESVDDQQHSPKSAPATSIFFPDMEIPSRPVPMASRSPNEPYATGAAEEIVNHAMHLRGIYHGRSDDYEVPSAAAADTVGNHVIHHLENSRLSTQRLSQQATATAAGSIPAGMICVAHFLASVFSRCSLMASSSSPAALDHSGAAFSAAAAYPVQRPASQRRFGNGKEFVLHWALICVLIIISMCFLCGC